MLVEEGDVLFFSLCGVQVSLMIDAAALTKYAGRQYQITQLITSAPLSVDSLLNAIVVQQNEENFYY